MKHGSSPFMDKMSEELVFEVLGFAMKPVLEAIRSCDDPRIKADMIASVITDVLQLQDPGPPKETDKAKPVQLYQLLWPYKEPT